MPASSPAVNFLRKAAVITGGTAAGLGVLGKMAHAQSGTKMRVWLFKSFVTASNDILAKQVEAWGAERKVQVDMDWATFGDREQKFVAAIEAGNPPDIGEMNYLGPTRYKSALRDVSKLAKDIASARGGLLPFAERATNVGGQFYGVARLIFPGGFFVRKDLLDAKGVKLPKLYDPDVVEMAKKCQDPVQGHLGIRPDAEPLGRRQRLHEQYPPGLRRGRLGQGRQARAGHVLPEAEPGRAAVRRRHDPEVQDPAAGRHVLDGRAQQRGIHRRQAGQHQ